MPSELLELQPFAHSLMGKMFPEHLLDHVVLDSEPVKRGKAMKTRDLNSCGLFWGTPPLLFAGRRGPCRDRKTMSLRYQATVKSTLKPGKPCKGLKDSQGTQLRSL